MSNKKLRFKLTFQAKYIKLPNMEVEMCVCNEFPELAIMRRKDRFLWKDHYIARIDGVEYELPTLQEALVLILQQKGFPAEALTEELKKYVEEAVN